MYMQQGHSARGHLCDCNIVEQHHRWQIHQCVSHQLPLDNLWRMGTTLDCPESPIESNPWVGAWHSSYKMGPKQPCQGCGGISYKYQYLSSKQGMWTHFDIVSGLCWKCSCKSRIEQPILHMCKNIATCSSTQICLECLRPACNSNSCTSLWKTCFGIPSAL